MSQSFWNMLAEKAGPEQLKKTPQSVQTRLRNLSEHLDVLLACSDPIVRSEILTKLCTEVLGHLRRLDSTAQQASGAYSSELPSDPIDPKYLIRQEIDPAILEWARAQINEEEIVRELNEIRKTGGHKLADFIHELEEAKPHE